MKLPAAVWSATVILAVAGGCSRSRSSVPSVVTSARIGPEGGVLVVDDGGPLDGLVVTVDPGVLSEPVEFRIVDEYVPPPPGGVSSPVQVPPLGRPFRIEPIDLVLRENVGLLVPYSPNSVFQTGPGNVELRQVSPYTTRTYIPRAVDAAEGRIEVGVKTFGSFRVWQGPTVLDPADYMPPIGQVATCAGGLRFVVEPMDPASPLASPGGVYWRVTGPAIDEALVVVDRHIVGRRAFPDYWRETWDEPYYPFASADVAMFDLHVQTMLVESPLGNPPLGGAVMPLGYLEWLPPQEYDGRLLLDVAKLTLNVAFDRADGSGERRLALWLAPGQGLVSLAVDDIVYARIPD